MNVPNPETAIVEREKLSGYLLSATHPVGRFKAAFFNSLGYEAEQWQVLAADLRGQHLPLEVAEVQESAYGRKFVVRGNLKGPSGKSAVAVSVWIVLATEDQARFVTAYPGEI